MHHRWDAVQQPFSACGSKLCLGVFNRCNMYNNRVGSMVQIQDTTGVGEILAAAMTLSESRFENPEKWALSK